MSKMLLLADDSVTIQKVVELIFAHGEYDLKCAENGDLALEQARLARPDVVLADANMPGRNGYELCAAIKADPALKKVPVLMLAGTFEPFDEEKARSVGADGWITKPFESQALIEEVESLMVGSESAAADAADGFESGVEGESDMWTGLGFNDSDSNREEDEPALAEVSGEGEMNEQWIGEELAVEDPAPAEASPFESALSASEPEDSDTSAGEEILFLDESDLLDEIQMEGESSSDSDPDFTVDDAEEEESESFTETLSEGFEFETATPPEQDVVPEVTEPEVTEPEMAEPEMAQEASSVPENETGPGYFRDTGLINAPADPPPHGELTEKQAEQRVEALSEEQLDRIVERVAGTIVERLAGSILEKIAWEVVPDLAEVMIKEEIRKITEDSP